MTPRCAHLADSDGVAAALHAHEDQHHVVDHDRHTVVQQRLAKHEVVKVRVNSNLVSADVRSDHNKQTCDPYRNTIMLRSALPCIKDFGVCVK